MAQIPKLEAASRGIPAPLSASGVEGETDMKIKLATEEDVLRRRTILLDLMEQNSQPGCAMFEVENGRESLARGQPKGQPHPARIGYVGFADVPKL